MIDKINRGRRRYIFFSHFSPNKYPSYRYGIFVVKFFLKFNFEILAILVYFLEL